MSLNSLDNKNMNDKIQKRKTAHNERFHASGVYARRQFCADLEVCRPPEHLWTPRLREAATTLPASRGTAPSLNTLTLFSATFTNDGIRKKRTLPKKERQKLQF